MDSPHYLALIGKSVALAAAELDRVLHRSGASAVEFYPPYFYKIIGDIDPLALINQLGGTVKIYQLIDANIADRLINNHQDHFCLSSISRSQDLVTTAKTVKQKLKEQGIKPHFRILDDPFYSAGITTKYSEFTLIPDNGQVVIAEAVAVQNLNYWTQKDYGRPAFDPSVGMLPPKVSRMMLNLALPNELTPNTLIYDPMCGSGTILLEGLDLNLKVVGSDHSQKAVDASSANTNWFIQKYQPTAKAQVFLADATHVQLSDINQPPDAIVFEGYLGPPHPTDGDVPNLVKGLEKLYRGIFKNLLPLLKPHARLVCALPEYHSKAGVKTLDHLVDGIASLGYTRLERFTYGRPQAFTKRSIFVLQKA